MYDLRSIYIANGVGIFMMAMLAYTARTTIRRRGIVDRLFTFMIFGVMIACFMEAFSYTIDGKTFPGAIVLNYIANTYLFTVNMLLPLSVLMYVDLSLYGDRTRILSRYRPQLFIGAVMLCANVVNFFIPITYVITENNVYIRQPFSYVCYFVILYYSATAMAITHRYKRETGAKSFLSINMFLLPIIVGAGLQFAFYGLSMAWLSASVGLTCLYMMQQNEMAYVDSLSDAYNRQYMNHIVPAWINSGKTFAGVMIDVDRFKDINDTLGHSEGDRVLRDVVDILKSARKEGEIVFRFAGDEFIVLRMTEDMDGLAGYMDRVKDALQRYNEEKLSGLTVAGDRHIALSLSYGTSFYDGGDIDMFLKEMDHNMYLMKAVHHSGDRRRSTDRKS